MDPTNLGRRERQIMDVVFRLGRASVKDVVAGLAEPPTYSTVRAMLGKLEQMNLDLVARGRQSIAQELAAAEAAKNKPDDEKPTSYLQAAVRLLQTGDVDSASKLVCVAALVQQDDTVETYLRWSPALKRPVIAIQWGLGAVITLPTDDTENSLPDDAGGVFLFSG